MSWARIDDQFHSHPKTVAAGNEAAGVFARALSYCSAYLTDGFVSSSVARAFGGKRPLEKLSGSGLWQPVKQGEQRTVTDRRDSGHRPLPDVTVTMTDDGYFIPDYLHYHPSREEEQAKKRSRIESGSRGGQRSKSVANAQANAQANVQQVRAPHARGVPVPVPKNNTFERPTTVETVDNFLVFAGSVGLTTTQRDEAMQLPVHLIDEAIRRTERFHPENQAAYFCAVVRDFAAARQSKVAPLSERLESFARNVRHALTDDELELELREKGADDALVARLLPTKEAA